MATEWIHELTVVKLRDELKARELPTTGKKVELVKRLEDFLVQEGKQEEGTADEAGKHEGEAVEGGEAAVEAGQELDAAEHIDDEAPAEEVATKAQAPDAEKVAQKEVEETSVKDVLDTAEADKVDRADQEQQVADSAEPGVEKGEEQAAEQAAPTDAGEQAAEPAAPTEAKEQAAEPAAPTETKEQAPEQPSTAKEEQGGSDAVEPSADAAEQPQAQDAAEAGRPSISGKDSAEEPAGPAMEASTTPQNPEEAVDLDYGEDEPVAPKRLREEGDEASKAPKAARLEAPGGPSAGRPTTRALRINGFVRPLTERGVRALLDPEGTRLKALWMPSMKTHCYAVFADVASAGAAHAATAGLQWPAGSPKTLDPMYVSVREAEIAIGQGAGNPDFRVERTPEDGPEPEAPSDEKKEGVDAKPEQAPAKAAPASREWDKDKKAPPQPKEPAAETRSEGVKDLRELLQRRKSGGPVEVAERVVQVAAAVEPIIRVATPAVAAPLDVEMKEPPTLDELFRKTEAKPMLYWLPLTEEQIAAKKAAKA